MIYQPFHCVVPTLFHSTMVIKACNMKVNIQSVLDYNLDLIQYVREFLQNVLQMDTFPETFYSQHFPTGCTHYHLPLLYPRLCNCR